MTEPLLSICIPTYNRSTYLKQALEAYTSNAAFDDDVEIVISDNASTDDTPIVCKEYTTRYPNIKYFRNKENVIDANFCLALDRGTGRYLKLMNDNVVVSENGLFTFKDVLKKYEGERIPVFFTAGNFLNGERTDEFICQSFDDFIIHVSYVVTAIMLFGAWRSDWQRIKDRSKYSKLKLSQDDWAYQIMAEHNTCVLCTNKFGKSLNLDSKCRSGYNWFEVHVDNYYTIMQPYFEKGHISKSALLREKRTYLLGLKDQIFWTYIYKVPTEWQFDTSGTTCILWRNFKEVPFFYLYMGSLPVWGGIKWMKHIYRRFKR